MANPNHAQIAMLAHHLWEERGRPEGAPEEDWQLAERLLESAAHHNTVESFAGRARRRPLRWRMDRYPLFYRVEPPPAG
ncbi:MAG: DUF2934 domain-containing protein [Steroidobacteraceae bacterium]